MKRRMAGTLLQSKGMKSFGRYGAVGFELLASIAVGYYLGHWLDGKFGTRWIAFVGFLVGCYAGFSALFRTAKQMQRDIEREEKLERGEDPWGDEDGARDVDDEPTGEALEGRTAEAEPVTRERP
ncbi:MAG: AtpZ/AtpI family protein [Labilithrix sp.]|nr:AtpZ/AtpI family protein [Labilithrix sp.]MCW5834273.1 AtpZ/AtpI family protein [Labilithrix sp.]